MTSAMSARGGRVGAGARAGSGAGGGGGGGSGVGSGTGSTTTGGGSGSTGGGAAAQPTSASSADASAARTSPSFKRAQFPIVEPPAYEACGAGRVRGFTHPAGERRPGARSGRCVSAAAGAEVGQEATERQDAEPKY